MEKQADTKAEAAIKNMFKAGAHYAYSKSRRHPSAQKYIFGAKNRVEIFDLEKTQQALEEARSFIEKLGQEGKILLFVGGKSESKHAVEKGAQALGMPHVGVRFKGGTLTNFPEIQKRTSRLEELREKRDHKEFDKYTKKERLLIDREIEKLEESFGGIVSMKNLPHAMFVVDPRHEHVAVKEAQKLSIPVVALASSDCDFSQVDFPVPANDSSLPSIELFVSEIVSAYRAGQKDQQEKEKNPDKKDAETETSAKQFPKVK